LESELSGYLVYGNPTVTNASNPFDAIGDPSRRAILELLGSGDRSVREVADELPISRPAVSKHLRLLKQAGLVDEERHGTRTIYRLRAEGLASMRAYLEQLWGDAAARYRLLAENSQR
jgi:DNA-binding transcriptional ArsR family regulator